MRIRGLVVTLMAAVCWPARAGAGEASPTIALGATAPASSERPTFGVETLAGRAGGVGLPGMSSAQVGPAGGLRLGLGGELFRGSNFLVSAPGSSGDRNTRVRGVISLGGTPWSGVELFAAISGAANRNRRICGQGVDEDRCVSESGRGDPEVIRTSAALALGGKLAMTLPAGWAMGTELGVRLLPSLGGVAFDGDATSAWLDVLAGIDLREHAGIPLRSHLATGFHLDNSYNLGGRAGENASARLVSAFAHGLGRERLRAALGVDAPWREPWAGRLLRPSLEYHLEVVTADPDPFFAGMSELPDNRDQHWLTVGLAVQGRRGWAVSAAADLALRSPGFAHGPRLPTASFALAFSQALDLSAPRQVTRVVERPVPAPKREGEVSGRVVGEGGAPIDGALVAIEGRPQSRVASDPDGSFRARSLPPGPLALLVSAPGFAEVRLPATVVAGADTPLSVTLARRRYAVTGRMADFTGSGVGGTVRALSAQGGEQPAALAVDGSGVFILQVPAGRYRVRLDADGFLSQLAVVEVGGDGQVRVASSDRVDPVMRPRPPAPRFTFADGVGRFAVAFPFVAQPDQLSPEGRALLDEVVDALLQQSEAPAPVRVEVHWDGGQPEEEGQRRSEDQASRVRRYLVERGLDEGELEVAALGRARPLPGQPRARQRRLEIHQRLP